MSEEDRNKANKIIEDSIVWLEGQGQNADTEEFKKKLEEVENIWNPIMQKFYGSQQQGEANAGGAGFPGQQRDGQQNAQAGPNVDEVD